jgi:hypothetical protein
MSREKGVTMFPMIKYFFNCWSPFTLTRFPYNLYSWVLPFYYMVLDIGRWVVTGTPRCFTWNLDLTLAVFILPKLRIMKVEKMGTPAKYIPDYEYGDDKDMLVEGAKAWMADLDEIIWTFEAIKNNLSVENLDEDIEELGSKKAYARFEATEKRIEAGLKLFGENITSLWT